MVWVPTESAEVVTLAPLPRAPSRSELQARLTVRSPSSGSLALPEKATVVPVSSVVPSAGAVMETLGTLLGLMVTEIWSLSGRPPLSVTDAVMACVPRESRGGLDLGAAAESAVEARGPGEPVREVAVLVGRSAHQGDGGNPQWPVVPSAGSVIRTFGGVLSSW